MNLYLMLSRKKLGRVKIGISRNTGRRKKELGATPIFDGSFWRADWVEKFLHGFYSPLNAPSRGNGGTEWFWCFNIFTACGLVIWQAERFFSWWGILVLIAPLPIDAFLLVVLFWILQRVVLLGLVSAVLFVVLKLK